MDQKSFTVSQFLHCSLTSSNICTPPSFNFLLRWEHVSSKHSNKCLGCMFLSQKDFLMLVINLPKSVSILFQLSLCRLISIFGECSYGNKKIYNLKFKLAQCWDTCFGLLWKNIMCVWLIIKIMGHSFSSDLTYVEKKNIIYILFSYVS